MIIAYLVLRLTRNVESNTDASHEYRSTGRPLRSTGTATHAVNMLFVRWLKLFDYSDYPGRASTFEKWDVDDIVKGQCFRIVKRKHR